MSTYKESGVDVNLGDECSRIAYEAAKRTFPSRKGMIGEPVVDNGGFAGMLDMGNYFLVQNDDGIGTKMILAEEAEMYDTMGYDLLAMVTDDAICVGAEVISMTNTIDVDKVDKRKIGALMKGLEKACREQKVVIPGGEIAELGSMSKGYIWNATAVGIVEKHKVINGKDIKAGDKIIGLYSPGFRSNGFSLVRNILNKAYPKKKYLTEKFDKKRTYVEAALTPCPIFHDAILKMIGRFGQKAKVKIKGIAHITGGGIPGNITRILDSNKLGAHLSDPFEPDPIVTKLQQLGNVSDREAYETWNMGVGMVIVSDETERVIKELAKSGIKAKIIGEVKKKPGVDIISKGALTPGKMLRFVD